MEVDTTLVLELLVDSLVESGIAGSNVVPVDKKMPANCVDCILRSELKEKRNGCVSKQLLCEMDADEADKRLSKGVAFQLDDESGRLSSTGYEFVGVPDARQSFPSSS